MHNFLLLLAACGGYALDRTKGDADSAGTAPEDTSDADTGELDDSYLPDGWVLSADLPVVGGIPSLEGAAVTLEVVDSVQRGVACSMTLDTAGLAVSELTPDPTVWAWWTLDVVPLDEPCEEALPTTLGLGVGELVGDIRARLGTVEHDEVADSLYGAYLASDDGVVYVFGYAGTDGDLAGEDAASNPPGDGVYHLAPLYVFPLAD
jgi:hypothetical protein